MDANPQVRDELQGRQAGRGRLPGSLQRADARHADGLERCAGLQLSRAPRQAPETDSVRSTRQVLAHRHGRRARARGTRPARRRRVPAAAGGSRAAVPRADEQLDLHAARPVRPAAALGSERARGLDLDLGPGDRGVPARPAARRVGVCHRRGRPDHRAARGRLHPDRHGPRLRGARRDPDLLVRGDHQGHPADRRRARGSSPPTPTSPGRRRRARCLPPVRSPP